MYPIVFIANIPEILTCQALSSMLYVMPTIKISSKVEEVVWNDLKAVAKESHQNVSGLLTEAISEYLQRRRVRPAVKNHLNDSIRENEELGKLLAK